MVKEYAPKADDASSTESLLADWLARRDAGDSTELEELCRAHPERAERLRRLVGLLQKFEAAVAPTPARLPGAPSSAFRFSASDSERYEFIEGIGRGGMGEVVAVRDRVLPRTLAMKVAIERVESSPAGARSSRAMRRFLREAEILAQLDHPGIVPVHDLGVREDGRPYFTMRRIRGRDLREIFAVIREGRHGWNMTRALGVLARVAETTAFAHDRGVVHRDLKPSNVMVGEYGEVYVVDWGLAKHFEQDSEEELWTANAHESNSQVVARSEHSGLSIGTGPGDVLGTPAYMPPEQARGEPDCVGTCSDVYALGAMLYELLAGRAPYTDESQTTPSHVILGRLLQGPPQSLNEVARRAPPELVAIAHKAMARNVADRYSSMRALADDVAAFLEQRVVQAYETGTWAETKMWVLRNKALSAALAAAVVILIAGAVTSSVFAREASHRASDLDVANEQLTEKTREAQRNADNARKSASKAEESAREAVSSAELATKNEEAAKKREDEALAAKRRAERVTEFVQDVLINSDPNLGGEQKYLVVDAMEKAIKTLENDALKDDEEAEAAFQYMIAVILNGNARSEEALALAERALATKQRLIQGDHFDVAASLNLVAACLESLGRRAEALPKFEAAHEMWQRLLPGDDPNVAVSLNKVAGCLHYLGLSEKALPKFEAALDMFQRILQGDHHGVAQSLEGVASCLWFLGRSAEGLPKAEAGLEMYQRLIQGDHPNVARSLSNVAGCLQSLGRNAEALPKFEAALEMSQRRCRGDHPIVATSLSNVAGCLHSLDRSAEALPKFEAALEMSQRLYSSDHADVARDLCNVAVCLEDLGRSAEALPKHEAGLEMLKRLSQDDHADVATGFNNVACCLDNLGRSVEALSNHEAALEMYQRLFPGDHDLVATSLNNVAACLELLGRSAEALPKCHAALEMHQRLFRGDNPEVATCLRRIASCLHETGADQQALQYAERANEMALKVLPEAHEGRAKAAKLLQSIRTAVAGRR